MTLQIHLDDPNAYQPGDEIRGRVTWQSLQRQPKSVLISLLWHTEGKGTEDVEIIEQITVDGPSASGSREISFILPGFPWSFSGTLLSLVWAIEASLEPAGEVTRVNIVSAPGAEEIQL